MSNSVLKNIFEYGNYVVIELEDKYGYVNRSEIDLTNTSFSSKEIAELFCLESNECTKNVFILRNGAKILVKKSKEEVYVEIRDTVFGGYFNNEYKISDHTNKVYDYYMLQ